MKAFDCVKTNGQLQQKIDYYTKSSILSNWIDSYYVQMYRERSQFTEWVGENSTTLKKPWLFYSSGETDKQKIDKEEISDNWLCLHCHLWTTNLRLKLFISNLTQQNM